MQRALKLLGPALALAVHPPAKMFTPVLVLARELKPPVAGDGQPVAHVNDVAPLRDPALGGEHRLRLAPLVEDDVLCA